jgi:hypothetical protein
MSWPGSVLYASFAEQSSTTIGSPPLEPSITGTQPLQTGTVRRYRVGAAHELDELKIRIELGHVH